MISKRHLTSNSIYFNELFFYCKQHEKPSKSCDDKHSIHHVSINFRRQLTTERRDFYFRFAAFFYPLSIGLQPASPSFAEEFSVKFPGSRQACTVYLAPHQNLTGKNKRKSLARSEVASSHGNKSQRLLWHQLVSCAVDWIFWVSESISPSKATVECLSSSPAKKNVIKSALRFMTCQFADAMSYQ